VCRQTVDKTAPLTPAQSIQGQIAGDASALGTLTLDDMPRKDVGMGLGYTVAV